MFDFAEILDATEDITVELRGRPIVCSVFTAGYERIPYNDQLRLSELNDEAMPVQQSLEKLEAEIEQLNGDNAERKAQIEKEISPLRRQSRRKSIEISWQLVPLALKEWTYEGEPLQYHGACPPSECKRLPDDFVMEVAAKAGEVWSKNQKKGLKPFGSPVTENAEGLQAESITPSSD